MLDAALLAVVFVVMTRPSKLDPHLSYLGGCIATGARGSRAAARVVPSSVRRGRLEF